MKKQELLELIEAGEDYLKTILSGPLDKQNVPENVPEKEELSLKVSIKMDTGKY